MSTNALLPFENKLNDDTLHGVEEKEYDEKKKNEDRETDENKLF